MRGLITNYLLLTTTYSLLIIITTATDELPALERVGAPAGERGDDARAEVTRRVEAAACN